MNHEGRGVLTTLLLAGMLILGTGVPTCHAQAATSVVVFPDANFFTLFGGLDISVAQDFVTNAWHVLVLEAGQGLRIIGTIGVRAPTMAERRGAHWPAALMTIAV